MTWHDHDVLEAAAAWRWYPEDADVAVRDDVTIVRWPAWSPQGAVVLTTRTGADLARLYDAAFDVARDWGRDRLGWWVTGAAHPDLEPLLRSRGGRVVETVDVLARPLGPDAPDAPAASAGIDVDQVTTPALLRAADVVDVAVWDQEPMDTRRLAAALAELGWREDGPWTLRVVAHLDGAPVATGGATVVAPPRPGMGRVARLWGAATLPGARGRGAYRAVLGERLRLATAGGATLALVKGRVETSAPVLARAGFRAYATERLWQLPV